MADWLFEHEADEWFDGDFRDDDENRTYRGLLAITCKYCKKQGFHWQSTPNGWRLFNNERMHYCKGIKDAK